MVKINHFKEAQGCRSIFMRKTVEDRALLLSSVSQDCKLVNAALLAEVFAGRRFAYIRS